MSEPMLIGQVLAEMFDNWPVPDETDPYFDGFWAP